MRCAAAVTSSCLIGHPFNPPHIIQLVEVDGGTKTSPAAIQQAGDVLRVDRKGGIKHFMEQLMDPLAAMIKTLGNPNITPELIQSPKAF